VPEDEIEEQAGTVRKRAAIERRRFARAQGALFILVGATYLAGMYAGIRRAVAAVPPELRDDFYGANAFIGRHLLDAMVVPMVAGLILGGALLVFGFALLRSVFPLGLPVHNLTAALDTLASDGADRSRLADAYARAEAALASGGSTRHSQAAQHWQYDRRAQAAELIGQLELEPDRPAIRDDHRQVIAQVLSRLLLDQWPSDAPSATGSRLAAARRAQPHLTRVGAALAVVATALPVAQAAWTFTRWLWNASA
jgi:hypothetical protein